MPNYDYLCRSCGQKFEIHHKMNESAPKFGPDCAQKNCALERQISAPAAMVKSSNPIAGGSLTKAPKDQSKSALTEPAHTCGSGCTFHRH